MIHHRKTPFRVDPTRVQHTWRIIPVSKWLVNPIYKPWNAHLEGEQPYLGDLLTMVINHLLTGMILQAWWCDPRPLTTPHLAARCHQDHLRSLHTSFVAKDITCPRKKTKRENKKTRNAVLFKGFFGWIVFFLGAKSPKNCDFLLV